MRWNLMALLRNAFDAGIDPAFWASLTFLDGFELRLRPSGRAALRPVAPDAV